MVVVFCCLEVDIIDDSFHLLPSFWSHQHHPSSFDGPLLPPSLRWHHIWMAHKCQIMVDKERNIGNNEWKERNSCHKKQTPVRGWKFQLKEIKTCYRGGNGVTERKFLLPEINSCYWNEIPVTGRKILVKEGYIWYRKDYSVTERKFPGQFCCRK